MNYLFNRFKEPSSAAGVTALTGIVSAWASGQLHWGAALAAGVPALYSILKPEGGSSPIANG